jgi:hypothetical protein
MTPPKSRVAAQADLVAKHGQGDPAPAQAVTNPVGCNHSFFDRY